MMMYTMRMKIKRWLGTWQAPYILAAILLRLLLMPFFGHTDIFNTYRRASRVAFEGVPLYALNEQLIHGIEAAWLVLISLVTGSQFFSPLAESILQIQQVNALLFLFKMPYLIGEIVLWYLLFRYLIKPERLVFLFVLFNPIMIFTSYIFGRYDTIVCASIALFLVLVKRNAKLLPLTGSVALMILLRPSMLLLLPVTALIRNSILSKVVLLTVPAAIYGAVLLLNKLTGGNLVNWVVGGRHSGLFFGAQLPLESDIFIFLFFSAVAFAAMHLLGLYLKKSSSYQSIDLVALGGFTVFGLYYATSVFHAQYVAWILPFVYVLLYQFRRDPVFWTGILGLHVLYFAVIMTRLTFGEPTNFILLFPIAPVFAQIPLPAQFFLLSNIAKSAFTGILIYLISYVFRHYEQTKK